MKPVIIIAIAVVCSVVTVLGILGTMSYIEDMENQLFRNDLLLATNIHMTIFTHHIFQHLFAG